MIKCNLQIHGVQPKRKKMSPMDNVWTKRVSLIELFYDLVFVYMISQATSLIHHLHHGVISPVFLTIFTLVVIVFINSWMVQMVFTNRYGKSSWTNISFSFIDMAIVLYMSNAFSATFDHHLATIFTAAGLLSLTLCLQYLIVYHQAEQNVDRQISQAFALILVSEQSLFWSVGYSPIGSVLQSPWPGLSLAGLGPPLPENIPAIIFSHLLERLTALIILMFGEAIVGIAGYFTQTRLLVFSILFLSVLSASSLPTLLSLTTSLKNTRQRRPVTWWFISTISFSLALASLR